MDSYNSKYPLEYYEVGTPYMFYLTKGAKCAKAAPANEISKFKSVLKNTQKQQGAGYAFADRVIGVVVEKDPVKRCLEVLFEGDADGKEVYLAQKYITGSAGVFCDEKELHSAAGKVYLKGEVPARLAPAKSAKIGGGIDLDDAKIGGGIDLDDARIGGGIDLDDNKIGGGIDLG